MCPHGLAAKTGERETLDGSVKILAPRHEQPPKLPPRNVSKTAHASNFSQFPISVNFQFSTWRSISYTVFHSRIKD
jgi:hypothetical protein